MSRRILDYSTTDLDFPVNAIDRRNGCSIGCNDDDVIHSSALLQISPLLVGKVLAVALLVTGEFTIVVRLVDEVAFFRPVPSSIAKAGQRVEGLMYGSSQWQPHSLLAGAVAVDFPAVSRLVQYSRTAVSGD
ncbi:unnamed protein product [Toxocara canis]|uniref:S1 motif domain-containing protein n=1 Tax=Toxocara canis TaxID=6265 RepID=A0A183UB46_TOXCA|nr:unnamed protein product [Toxocara canis]